MFMKLFDLIPVVENINTYFSNEEILIECIEGYGSQLFIGTSQGDIILLSICEFTNNLEKVEIQTTEWLRTTLPTKKAVLSLKYASALQRLFALSDGTFYYLKLEDSQLTSGLKVRTSVSCFALNEFPVTDDPYLIQLAVGSTRRQILIVNVVDDKFDMVTQIDTDDTPVCMIYENEAVCYATREAYYVVHLSSKATKRLFDIQCDEMVPVIKIVAKDEYLLNCGLQNLGMFSNSEGTSTRVPISWSSGSIKSVAFSDPYILSLSEQFISVFSILDQKLKQQISFCGRSIGDYEGQVYVTSKRQIHLLKPVSWEKRVDMLLNEKLADEALHLAQTSRKSGVSKEEFIKIFRRIQQKAGFIKFEQGKFDEALNLLVQGKIDTREIICLFPHLLSVSSNFIASTPALHNIPSVLFIAKSIPNFLPECTKFLLEFLNCVRDEPWTQFCIQDVDTAILKLFSEFKKSEIADFIKSKKRTIDLVDFEQWCNRFSHFDALATFFWVMERRRDALDIWQKLADGHLQDESFTGLKSVFDLLSDDIHLDLLANRLKWFIERDLDSTVELLARYAHENETDVSNLLENDSLALRKYLERLVLDYCSQDEDLHIRLYKLYSNLLLSNTDTENQFKENFRRFLYTSNFYPVHNLLREIEQREDMTYEKAILFGKLKKHDKALEILINEMKDYDAAEQYCANVAKNDSLQERQKVYSMLLQIYLSKDSDETFSIRATNLLNDRNLEINLLEVLNLLPVRWSLQQLQLFLQHSIVKCKRSGENTRLAYSLAKSLNDKVKLDQSEMSKKRFDVVDSRLCTVCQSYFIDPECVIYPDGTVVHKNCAKRKYLSTSTGRSS